MRYNQLGRTGLFVSELCLGTMTFGGAGMFKVVGSLQQDDADALMRATIDAGVNFIDTANVYSRGLSEEITGQSLKNLGIARDEVVIATKVMGPMGEGPNMAGTSRGHIMDQAKASLKRLGTDHIDLYQIHGWDPVTPIDETLRALDDLVRQGHVRYIGVSNWAAWQIAKALGISAAQGLARFDSLQAYYTIAGRDLERELVPMMASEGVGLMVWSPLAGGLLSGKFRKEGAEGRRKDFHFPPVDTARLDAALDAMEPVAAAHGASLAQVAIAWLLHQRAVTSVIVGATRADQLADNLAAADIALTPEELAALNAATALPPEYPGWMIERQSDYRKPGRARG
ncbi:aldo/keto reductase [Sphingomonas canadensis]|uniref:Aldo/keto reductase n=1 Tax=Sphingomonas canadensis TaxID=1219257 RepID=A0ABW3H741_9SPHN|nr:aldo/keto reductase [Sphingomonas canadensis]MCW3834649.1 aldo/keto reductase [Sphingomonas canadensis]